MNVRGVKEREKARHASMTQEERDEKNKKLREKYHQTGKHGCHQAKKGKGKGTIGGNDSGRKK